MPPRNTPLRLSFNTEEPPFISVAYFVEYIPKGGNKYHRVQLAYDIERAKFHAAHAPEWAKARIIKVTTIEEILP